MTSLSLALLSIPQTNERIYHKRCLLPKTTQTSQRKGRTQYEFMPAIYEIHSYQNVYDILAYVCSKLEPTFKPS